MKITHHSHTANANSIRFSVNELALFSYETLVAVQLAGILYVDSYNYSPTTNKHITQFTDKLDRVLLTQNELQLKLQSFMANTLINKVNKDIL